MPINPGAVTTSAPASITASENGTVKLNTTILRATTAGKIRDDKTLTFEIAHVIVVKDG